MFYSKWQRAKFPALAWCYITLCCNPHRCCKFIWDSILQWVCPPINLLISTIAVSGGNSSLCSVQGAPSPSSSSPSSSCLLPQCWEPVQCWLLAEIQNTDLKEILSPPKDLIWSPLNLMRVFPLTFHWGLQKSSEPVPQGKDVNTRASLNQPGELLEINFSLSILVPKPPKIQQRHFLWVLPAAGEKKKNKTNNKPLGDTIT